MAKSAKYTFHYISGSPGRSVESEWNDGESVKEYNTLAEALEDADIFFENHPLENEEDEEQTDLIIRRTASDKEESDDDDDDDDDDGNDE